MAGVERFGKLSEKVNKELPKLEISHRDFEHERMAMIVEAIQEPTAVGDAPYCRNAFASG
jgi:DNA recombination protein RmuC